MDVDEKKSRKGNLRRIIFSSHLLTLRHMDADSLSLLLRYTSLQL